MPHDIPLLIALVAPVVVMTLLGINAAMVFLSLCLGQVLVHYVASDAISVLTTFSPHASEVSKSMLQLCFLYLPAVLTAILMIGSVKGKLRRMANILPAAGVGLLGTLMGVPLFAPGLRHAIEAGSSWQQLSRAQALVVGVTALISLLFLWSQRSSLRGDKSHRSKHLG